MLSPFPGMDPYLENKTLWSSFHNSLADHIQAQLNQQLGNKYIARTTPYVTFEIVEVTTKRFIDDYNIYPDVAVWQRPDGYYPEPLGGHGGAVTAVDTISPPIEVEVPIEFPLRLFNVEVRVAGTKRLVTIIEILSPVNKRPSHEAYQSYQRKRHDILRSQNTHLLEIDLLRGGTRPQFECTVPPAPYYAVLSRANRRSRLSVWPIQLADKLPVLPVPLLEPDPDLPLDLGAAVATVYQRGAYDREIDYQQAPPPPKLTEVEAAWVDKLLHRPSYTTI